MVELVSEQCRGQAEMWAKRGNHYMALRWYNTARARTIGHKKSDEYERLAKEQAKLAGINYASASHTYAEDYEAEEVKTFAQKMAERDNRIAKQHD